VIVGFAEVLIKFRPLSLLQNPFWALKRFGLTVDIYSFIQPGTAQAEACGYILQKAPL
jgi:hypothetical protein